MSVPDNYLENIAANNTGLSDDELYRVIDAAQSAAIMMRTIAAENVKNAQRLHDLADRCQNRIELARKELVRRNVSFATHPAFPTAEGIADEAEYERVQKMIDEDGLEAWPSGHPSAED